MFGYLVWSALHVKQWRGHWPVSGPQHKVKVSVITMDLHLQAAMG